MKYTAKIKNVQCVGKVKIVPTGGELTETEKKEIINNLYGKDLILKGYLVIDGVKPSSVLEGATKDQLVAYAVEKEIAIPENGTAKEILAAIKKADGKN